MTVGVAGERTGAKGVTEPRRVDRTGRDEREPMLTGEPQQRIQTVGDKCGLPVSDVVGAKVEGRRTSVSRSQILE